MKRELKPAKRTKTTHKKWNEEEIKYLNKCIKEHGFTEGCRITAKKTGHTETACNSMYSTKRFRELAKRNIPETHEDIRHERKAKKMWSLGEENRKLLAECLKKRLMSTDDSVLNAAKYIAPLFDISPITIYSMWEHKNHCNNNPVYKYNLFSEQEIKMINRRKGMQNRINEETEQQLAEYLKTKISENPNNLSNVFRDAAEKFGVATGTVANRWYGVDSKNRTKNIKSPCCRNNIGHVFTVIGANATVNGKNQNSPDVYHTESLFSRIVKWFKGNRK